MERFLHWVSDIFNCLKGKRKKNNSPEMADSTRYLGARVITAPKELKKLTPYLKLIRDCVEDENIKNIAITGTYGSGKSTVLKTFQNWYEPYRKRKRKNYLNISLASFDSKKGEEKTVEFERKVELSILQQMFYQVKPEKLPGSRFKRIINKKASGLLALILGVLLWLYSISLLFISETSISAPINFFEEDNKPWVFIFSWILFFGGIAIIMRKLYYLFNNSRIHKVSIKGEMELGDVGESVFNKYLEEILYFFERTDYRVVILEDIDRFGDTKLFTKLSEINVLLNNSESIKRPIKFIYAIKDDMFQDRTERTKFFDFIIPIIPYVNPHNASEQLKKLIKENNIELSTDFISDITSFVGDIDMRLILNVFNEFNLYKEKITVPNQDRLMAMVFYKNLYPKDFAELHQDKGKLFNLLSKKQDYRDILAEKIKKEIDEKDDEIKKINEERQSDIKELRMIYLYRIMIEIPELSQFNMDFSTLEEATKDDNFQVLKEAEKLKYSFKYYDSYNGRWKFRNEEVSNPFTKIEKKVSEIAYEEREEHLLNKRSGRLEQLKKEKLRLSERESRINLLDFSKLMIQAEQEEDFNDFKENFTNPGELKLIKYLLLQGYIGEDYQDYISLFFDVSIKKEDYDFIQKLKLGEPTPFDFHPSKVGEVLHRIPVRYFAQPQSLNYDLFSYCLRNEVKNKLNLSLNIIAKNEKSSLEFIQGFIKDRSEKEIQAFVKLLCKTKTNLLIQLFDANLPEENLKEWIIFIFRYAENNEDILSLEQIELLVEYLSKQKIFELAGQIGNSKILGEFIPKKKIEISELDIPHKEEDELFQSIYENGCYKINWNNISQITKYLKPEVKAQELKTRNYTVIRQLQLKPLLKFVDSRIELYINRVLLLEENREESEGTLLKIINEKDLDEELKKKFILHQKKSIAELIDIPELANKELALRENKVLVNWVNVFNYYKTNEKIFNDFLIDYLNKESNYSKLGNKEINFLDQPEKEKEEFISALVRMNEIENIAYEQLIKSLPYSFKFFDIESLEEGKVEILIREKVLSFNSDNFESINSFHPNFVTTFFVVNQGNEKFEDVLMELNLSNNVICELLKEEKFQAKYKELIVNSLDEKLIIDDSELAKNILDWWILQSKVTFGAECLQALFKTEQRKEKKILMILKFFDNLEKEEIKKIVSLIGEEFKKLFTPNQKPKFSKSTDLLELLQKLKSNRLISSVKVGNKHIRAFPFNK